MRLKIRVLEWVAEVTQIIQQSNCPGLIHKPICKKCSYFDFSYASEISQNKLN